jgi:iron complex outermembrane receptor protein
MVSGRLAEGLGKKAAAAPQRAMQQTLEGTLNITTTGRARALALCAGSALAALCLAGAPALALAADAPATTAEVETVIITAQKRSEDIQKVPESVTNIGAEKLAILMSGGGDIRFLSSRVPSLTLESSFGRTFPRFYIRGLGNTDFDLNASQPVSLVYDDVVLESPIVKGYPAFDLDHIEVLRGPQGTLFGRNTPAGIVKLDSAKPTFKPTGYASASWGTFNTINAEAAVGGPLVADKLAGRASVLIQHRDNWVDNGFTHVSNATEGYKEYAGRVQLLFTPDDSFSALLNLHGMHLNGTPRLFRANIIKKGTNEFAPGYDRDTIYQDAQKRAFQHVDTFGGSLHMEYKFDGLTLTSITGYEHAKTLSRGDIDGGYGAVFAPPSGPGLIAFASESADGLPHHSQWTEELRLANDAKGPFTWQTGLFFFDENVTIDSFDYDTLFSGGGLDGYAQQHQKTKAWAGFGSVSYTFDNKLKLTGGLRYSNEKKDFDARRIVEVPAFIGGAQGLGVYRLSPKSDNVSWDVSADYPFSDDTSVYARIARGFRAPSIQGRLLFAPNPTMASTETVTSYETGVKSYLFEHRLRLSADVFLYDVHHQQLTAVGGTSNANTLVNADKTQGYGFEFDADIAPIEHLFITAGLSYNHTEIKDPTLAIAPCTGGCTPLDPAYLPKPGTVSINGNSLPNAPRWIANLTAKYAIPYGDGEFYGYTDWAYRSKIDFFLYESAEFNDDHLLEGGLRVGYSYQGGRYDGAVFVRNITNDNSLEGGIDFNNLTGFVNDPRTYGVEFKAKF